MDISLTINCNHINDRVALIYNRTPNQLNTPNSSEAFLVLIQAYRIGTMSCVLVCLNHFVISVRFRTNASKTCGRATSVASSQTTSCSIASSFSIATVKSPTPLHLQWKNENPAGVAENLCNQSSG